MPPRSRRFLLIAALVALTPFLSACGLATSDTSNTSAGTPPQANAGEREGTIPASAAQEAPADSPAGSPQQAVERFAVQYINWSYSTLAADASHLAAESLGEARAHEEQASAQAARDTPLARGHIHNSGTVIAVAHVRGGRTGEWVVDTREQTGGDQEYAGLQPTFHVTLATVTRVGQGYAVSAWRPQV